MGKKLSDLDPATEVVLTDIFHLRTPGGIDKKITDANLHDHITEANGAVLRVKIIDIGDWNMDATDEVYVNHGLDGTKIRVVSARIRNDANTLFYSLDGINKNVGIVQLQHESLGAIFWDDSKITLIRAYLGALDSVDFNAVGYNRGEIIIWYVE